MATALGIMRRWFAGSHPGLLGAAVEWRVPGYPVPREVYVGPEAVFGEFFPALRSRFADLGLELDELIAAADGERVTALGRYRPVTRRGEALSVPFIHVWTVRGDRIVRVVTATDTAALATAAEELE